MATVAKLSGESLIPLYLPGALCASAMAVPEKWKKCDLGLIMEEVAGVLVGSSYSGSRH